MAKSKKAKKRGPKFIEIDEVTLEKLCKMGARLVDVSDFFDCSEDTIERFCKRLGYKHYAEFRSRCFIGNRLAIRQKILEKALKQDNLKAQIYLSEKMGLFDEGNKEDFDSSSGIKTLTLAYSLDKI